MNKSIGALRALCANPAAGKGLVLPSRPEINSTAWGAKSTTIAFTILNRRYPAIVPARGDAPPAYPGLTKDEGDVDLSFLGFESERFIRNAGGGPGLGRLECLYRGAVFPAGAGNHNLPQWITKDLAQKSVTLQLYRFDDPGYTVIGQATLTYWAREYSYQYVADYDPGAPLFGDARDAPEEDIDIFIKRIEAFDLAGNPIEAPDFGDYNRELLWTLGGFPVNPWGRAFDCAETWSAEIIPVTPPITGAISGSEVLLAASGRVPFFHGSGFFAGVYGLTGGFGTGAAGYPAQFWPEGDLPVTVTRIVIVLSSGACEAVIKHGVTTLFAGLSLSTTPLTITGSEVISSGHLVLDIGAVTPTLNTFDYAIFGTL